MMSFQPSCISNTGKVLFSPSTYNIMINVPYHDSTFDNTHTNRRTPMAHSDERYNEKSLKFINAYMFGAHYTLTLIEIVF